MQNINSTAELREAIMLLEIKQLEEARKVKEEFHLLYESLKPINLIKDSIHNLITMPEIKGNILNLSLGQATGFLTKSAFLRGSSNPIKRLLGNVLQFGVGNYVARHPEGIKSAILSGIQSVVHKITERNSRKQSKERLYYDIE